MIAAPLATPDFRILARERLRREPPALTDALANPRGDHTLDDMPLAHPLDPKPAAVLVPVVMREADPTVLLTERATGLRQHSGQIAFPGGRVDPEDGTPLKAALREAAEEIGLERRFIEPLGYLDAYLSGTNYLVMPVVAAVEPGYALALNPDEVADAFEVPLHFLMDEANHQLHSREWKGRLRRYYAMPHGERYIWGVTAGIIRNLYERLYRP
jgi:8-oxo-dGTP pyrophosphatase MutT (NUDIX family)